MLPSGQKLHRSPLRPWLVAAVALLLLLGIAALGLRRGPEIVALLPGTAPPMRPAAPAVTAVRPPETPAGASPVAPAAPSFDVVRVDPHGEAVIAGRAAPGADVAVSAGGKEIGHATANQQGQWVLLPSAPLAPGPQELTLAERTPGTAPTTRQAGSGSVLLNVPDRTKPAVPALAVLEPPGPAAPRLLQAPGAAGPRQPAMDLDALDYDEHGAVRFAGHAPPGAAVRLYVDNQAVGDAVADAQGRWTLVPDAAIAPGTHRLRVDQLGATGRVTARVELPFVREAGSTPALAEGRVVVQPGQSLWRMARSAYGRGTQYTVIYQANRDQIRNPDLIYPGQTFSLPASGGD